MRNRQDIWKFRFADYGLYIIFIIIFAAFSCMNKIFVSWNNLSQLFASCAAMLVLCAGLTFVIITGALDLSVGSVMLLSGMLINLLVQRGWHPVAAIFCAVAVGFSVGTFNGFCIMELHANGFLVTYGTQIAVRGIALTLSNNASIFTDQGLKEAFRIKIIGLPLYIWIATLIAILAQFILKYSIYGRKVVATGCNETGAEKIGIRIKLIKGSVFAFSGLCAAVAGLIMVVDIGNCTPYAGNGMEFTGAAAVLMGGTSMYGGKGCVLPGTVVGVLLLQMMENGLTIMGINPYYLSLVRGGLIFIAMFVDSIKNKRA